MAVFVIFVVVVVSVVLNFCTGQQTSYLTKGYGNNQYGTKTAYFWAYPERNPVQNRLMKIALGGRACDAVHVNILSRHGARYTSVNDMRSFTTLQQKLSHTFTNKAFSFINDWVNKYPEDNAELLTDLGYKEMAYLGKFYGKELKSLLNGTVSPEGNLLSARFGTTRKTRTQESALWFYKGLTGVLTGQELSNLKPEVRDSVLRFYENCKRYEQETADLSEQMKFENGPLFQKVRIDVTRRLGTNASLSVGDIKMLYRLCATELAIMDNADWCKLMAESEREVLEYDNDIEDYITRLYGHVVTGQMSCPLGNDIFTAMDSAISAVDKGSSYNKGIFQFGHSDTVIDLAAGLGLFKDSDSLRADNYETMKNRTFRASTKDPFSTHFVFILYHCGGSGPENYALRLLFNGEPLTIPKCNSDTCWYNQVRQGYSQYIDSCDWSGVCTVGSNPSIVG